ncbi:MULTISPECIES: DNA-directed RNA polymerase subunit beta [unclassified Paenibacillus]|uniref:DNA-directed RNA polymerase subunit beta n=1 Tax=unclassified Paenibacillus TaxID=185978 RepID=UPI002F419EDA
MKVIRMADERIQSKTGFANQTTSNSYSRGLDRGTRSAAGLSRVQTYSSNRPNAAIGGYAMSSSQRDGDDSKRVPEGNIRIPESSRAQAELGESARSDKASAADKQSGQDELAEDEYYERPLGVRILLWILRKSIVPIIMIIMLVAGLYIGYTVLGEQPKEEVFQWPTWRHLYDLIFAES